MRQYRFPDVWAVSWCNRFGRGMSTTRTSRRLNVFHFQPVLCFSTNCSFQVWCNSCVIEMTHGILTGFYCRAMALVFANTIFFSVPASLQTAAEYQSSQIFHRRGLGTGRGPGSSCRRASSAGDTKTVCCAASSYYIQSFVKNTEVFDEENASCLRRRMDGWTGGSRRCVRRYYYRVCSSTSSYLM